MVLRGQGLVLINFTLMFRQRCWINHHRPHTSGPFIRAHSHAHNLTHTHTHNLAHTHTISHTHNITHPPYPPLYKPYTHTHAHTEILSHAHHITYPPTPAHPPTPH